MFRAPLRCSMPKCSEIRFAHNERSYSVFNMCLAAISLQCQRAECQVAAVRGNKMYVSRHVLNRAHV